MISRYFFLLILPCFIINTTLNLSHLFTGSNTEKLYPTGVSFEIDEECSLEELSIPSLVEFLLEECLDLMEDFPKTEESKSNSFYRYKVIQQKPILLNYQWFSLHAQATTLFSTGSYNPRNFHLTDYYGYLFRLTPF